MEYKIEILSKALDELTEAWIWYESELPGLGDRFEGEFFKKAELIRKHPAHYPIKNKYRRNNYRETLIDDFPYLIVYKIEEKDRMVFIHSVFHTSRHPKRKYK